MVEVEILPASLPFAQPALGIGCPQNDSLRGPGAPTVDEEERLRHGQKPSADGPFVGWRLAVVPSQMTLECLGQKVLPNGPGDRRESEGR